MEAKADRDFANQTYRQKKENTLALDLSLLRNISQDDEFKDFPEYFVPLFHLRDPFTILRNPMLIFNAALPPLPKNYGIAIRGGAERNREDWVTIETTEFMINSQGLPFDEAAMEAFRRGEPVLWEWDFGLTKSIGRQEHSRLRRGLTLAWAARLHKAQCVISKIRYRNKESGSHSAHFKEQFFKRLHGVIANPDGKYPISMRGADLKIDGIRSVYGMPTIAFNNLLKEEADSYHQLYGFSNSKDVDDYEFSILRIFNRVMNRAEAIESVLREITCCKKANKKISDEINKEYNDVLSGKIRNYGLSTYEYFMIALHSGFNIQSLHPKLERYSPYLGVAAWLGRLGHADKMELPPELATPLLEMLNASVTERFASPTEAVHVYDLLRRHAELFIGVNRLRSIAQQVRRSGYPSMVPRRIYGHVTRGPKKGSLVKFAPNEVPLAVPPGAPSERNAARKAASPQVRSFIPFAW